MENYCKPDCPICGGSGWVRADVDIDDPDFGKLHRCPNAPKDYSGIGLERSEFEFSMDKLTQTDDVAIMHNAIDKLFTDGKGMLYIQGGFGIGKTYTLKCATKMAIDYGYEALYIRHNILIDDLRQSYDDKSGQASYREKLNRYKNIQFLAIDEFGRERLTEFSKNAMAELYDARYEKAINGNLITILASNFSPENTMDAYMLDRARDLRCKVLELKGKSWRINGK